MKRKFVFLYSELAGYFLACIKKIKEKFPEAEVHVFRWPLNKEAPFQFQLPSEISFYDRADYPDEKLAEKIKEIGPDLIYCSGWMDKGYLKVCRAFKGRTVTVIGLDNPWKGDLKQVIRSFMMSLPVKTAFDYCWVPGERQRKYAIKLGFKKQRIRTGFYSADHELFSQFHEKFKDVKKDAFPHRFIFTGRYVENKGIALLWKAFFDLKNELKNDWELWCLGTGPLAPVEHPFIKHFGFVQPEKIEKFIRDTGVFVLPSTFEPWGVVVHEFAAAGFPMICSDEVGAAEAFLKHGRNGYLFESGNERELKDRLRSIMLKSDEDLFKMGELSAEFSLTISPSTWVEQLMTMTK